MARSEYQASSQRRFPFDRSRARRIFGPLAAACLLALPIVSWWWFSSPRQRHLAFNTMVLSTAVASLTVLLALPLSFLCARTDVPLRRWVWCTLTVLLFIPIYVQVAAWQSGFGRSGWYTIGSNSVATAWLSGWRAAIWVHVAAGVPWCAWILVGAWSSGWRDAERAASLDASPRRIFWSLTLRRARGWIVAAWAWVALTTSTELSVVDLFLIDTTARELYTGFALGRTFRDGLWTMAGPLFALLAIALFAARHWAVQPVDSPISPTRRLERVRHPIAWAGALLAWWLLFAALPLVNLVYDAGSSMGSNRLWNWSPRQLVSRLATSLHDFQPEIQWTLMIGVCAATLVAVLAPTIAALARHSRACALIVLVLTAGLLAVPGPLVGRGLVAILNRPAWPLLFHLYDASILAPVLAAAVRAWPLGIGLAWMAVRDIDRNQWNAARLDGADTPQMLRWIVFPQLAVPCALIWLLSFSMATGELAATLIVIPPGMETTAIRVANLMHTGLREKEAALCLWHVAAGLAAAAIASRLAKEWPCRPVRNPLQL